jgi:SAM-dependent methyltransferase
VAAFSNVYDDAARAAAYAKLEFPGTYYLAYRDLPAIIAKHVRGDAALDFGCGTGRSTRFLKELGFKTIGIDISRSMVELARQADPSGDYRLVQEGDFGSLNGGRFDLILSAFAFDNIPGEEKRAELLRSLRDLLNECGRIVILGSTPEIYTHEWASFTTKAYPENRCARSGDSVRIVMKDVEDARPVVDTIWFHDDYLELFAASSLALLATHYPLGKTEEHYAWMCETAIAPWVIYVLEKS